jgi:transcriptional regulator with XRE-family HTH domain/SOS-response transcriptional repressor LexA
VHTQSKPTDPHTLGERLAALRRAQGWTQRRLAEAAGVSNGYIAFLELGRLPSPGKFRLDAVARALGLRTSDALLSGATEALVSGVGSASADVGDASAGDDALVRHAQQGGQLAQSAAVTRLSARGHDATEQGTQPVQSQGRTRGSSTTARRATSPQASTALGTESAPSPPATPGAAEAPVGARRAMLMDASHAGSASGRLTTRPAAAPGSGLSTPHGPGTQQPGVGPTAVAASHTPAPTVRTPRAVAPAAPGPGGPASADRPPRAPARPAATSATPDVAAAPTLGPGMAASDLATSSSALPNVAGMLDQMHSLTARQLPVFRWGSCGDPRDRESPPDPDYLEYPPPGRESLIGASGFGVVVKGESMAGRGIHDGDVVWVNPERPYGLGKVVLALASDVGGEAGMVVKTYARTEVGECLVSETESGRSPLVCHEFKVIGPVVGITSWRLPS